jgi:hypothetical protein
MDIVHELSNLKEIPGIQVGGCAGRLIISKLIRILAYFMD